MNVIDVTDEVRNLVGKSACTNDANDALKFSQAACNVANARAALMAEPQPAKAQSSWARFVDFKMSERKHPCQDDQTKRIERLLERRCAEVLAKTAGNKYRQDYDVVTYEMSVMRHFEHPTSRIALINQCDMVGLIEIDDSVAVSMNDSELTKELTQSLLWALYKKKTVYIDGRSKPKDFEGNHLTI